MMEICSANLKKVLRELKDPKPATTFKYNKGFEI